MATIHDAAFFCISSQEFPQDNDKTVYVALSLTFGCAGVVGSLVQMLCLRATYRERRESLTTSGAVPASDVSPRVDNMVLLCLAVANLLACSGVMARASLLKYVGLLNSTSCGDKCKHNATEEQAIGGLAMEALITFGFSASAAWTLAYAAEVWYKLRSTDRRNAVCSTKVLRILELLLCWGLPIIATGLSVLFISLDHDITSTCPSFSYTNYHNVSAYAIIAVVMLVLPVCFYCATRFSKKVMDLSGRRAYNDRQVFRLFKIKCTLIVLCFVICWVPNLVEVVLTWSKGKDCKSSSSLFSLWAVEAALNPAYAVFTLLIYCHVVDSAFLRFILCIVCLRKHPNDVSEKDPLIHSYSVSYHASSGHEGNSLKGQPVVEWSRA